MGEIYYKYRDYLIELLNTKKIIILLSVTTILSYGFTITNFSVGVDDTAFDRYFRNGELLSQGRFGAVTLDKIFNMFDFAPFWMDTIATLLLFCSALLWCTLFMEISKKKISNCAYIIFTTVFISYPIINEIFIYMMASVPIGLGYLLTILALILTYEYIFNKEKKVNIIVAIGMMTFTISLNEAFAPVFLCGIFMILILRTLLNKESEINIVKAIKIIFKFTLVLAIAIVLESIISNLIIYILQLQKSQNAATEIYWFKDGSIINKIILLIKTIVANYILAAITNKSILIFVIACISCVIIAIYLSIKNKSIVLLLLFLALGISNVSLSIVQGYVSPYRTCLTFSIFIAFIFMVLFINLKNKKYNYLLLMVIGVIVIIQSKELSQAFYNDYKRYEQDKQIAIQTASIINYECDNEKPVVFIGAMPKYKNINYGQTNGNSVVNWGIKAFGENSTELLNFMQMYGFYFNQATDEQVKDAETKIENMPSYPKKGYIKEFDNYILVNFGK